MKKVNFEYADIDFETRSKAKLLDVGAYKYAEHESTLILIMCWSIDNGKTMHDWVIGDKPPKELFRFLRKPNTKIKAFNSFFEYCIWNLVAVPLLQWPEYPIEKFYDVMAESVTKKFAANLENAGEQMELDVTKDKEGKRLIQKFCKPRTAKSGPEWNEPEAHPIEFASFVRYCRIDVLTQIGVSDFCGALTTHEYKIFQLTEKMNARGLPLDKEMIEGALELIDYATKKANKKAQKLTKGAFESLTQRQAVKDWLEDNGLPMPDMQAKTIERILKKKGLPKIAKRVLQLRAETSKTSNAKYVSANNKISEENKVHDFVKYHIAGTGRWGGRGLQIQNFARPTLPKWVDYEFLSGLIKNKEIRIIETIYGDILNVLSSALRSMVCAPPGMKLVAADYAQIEARGLMWFAGEKEALKVFASGGDIYKLMASEIFKVPVSEVTDDQRFIGKQVILGLGFQMGADKFKKNMYDQFNTKITIEFAKEAVSIYRKKYNKVKKLWKETNDAAMDAVLHPGKRFYCASDKIYYIFIKADNFLYCVLPSGRKIGYYSPRVKEVPPPKSWNSDRMLKQLQFMGKYLQGNKWGRQTTYGGSLVENYTQGAMRDVMANGMLEAESVGYEQLFTVHDESIALVDEDFGSYKDYEKVLAIIPSWAKGLPVVAEGWEGKRYRK